MTTMYNNSYLDHCVRFIKSCISDYRPDLVGVFTDNDIKQWIINQTLTEEERLHWVNTIIATKKSLIEKYNIEYTTIEGFIGAKESKVHGYLFNTRVNK